MRQYSDTQTHIDKQQQFQLDKIVKLKLKLKLTLMWTENRNTKQNTEQTKI